jgi:hypothetical protein
MYVPSALIMEPITVAARSKASNVFALLNTGIVDSDPTEGMHICLYFFCVYLRERSCDGLILRPRSLVTVSG